MTQYDVHRNLDDETANDFPYVVDVQTDLLRHLETRLVVPLGRTPNFRSLGRLTPRVEVGGETLLFLVNHIVSIPRAALGPAVGSVENDRVELLNAIDFLVTGA